jgi:uroporphyrin-III C-methyltransferase / precorrin-2 dehydrogenase / sirohydrochlorin ferrochelatase
MAIDFRQRNRKSAPAARMEPLAKLPVFWDLAGKPVLIAGNSEAAAWKAELIAACGADVHVFLGMAPPIAALVALAAGSNRLFLHQDDWSRANLRNFAMAIADCDLDDEAIHFFEAAKSAGVPVNVIDKPAFCQFQFGSIVNRSPVIIAISTDGAAPILAQAIRRRIEATLPPALKEWAALAQRLRGEVCERLCAGSPRRRFWEWFVDRTFAGDNPPDETTQLQIRLRLENAGEDEMTATASITYVGAGPGDPDMLTLKAMCALQSADVILYDGGISGDVLRLARREATRIALGDASERPAATAEHTIAMARRGRKVVRLIVGDLSPTSQLNAELGRVVEAGLEIDIIPGVAAKAAWNSSKNIRKSRSAGVAPSSEPQNDKYFQISAL